MNEQHTFTYDVTIISSTSTTEGLRQGVLTNNTEGFSSETHSTHAVLIAIPAARRPEAQCVLARKPQYHGYLLRHTQHRARGSQLYDASHTGCYMTYMYID